MAFCSLLSPAMPTPAARLPAPARATPSISPAPRKAASREQFGAAPRALARVPAHQATHKSADGPSFPAPPASPSFELSASAVSFRSVFDEDITLANVNITPTATPTRQPISIVALIDTSGSMDSQAEAKSSEASQYSCLDLAKHSMSVLLHSLQSGDSLVLISFASAAKVIFQTSSFTPEQLPRALATITALEANGSTALWEAVQLGMVQARRLASTFSHTTVLLLTDGEPSDSPAGGIAAAFRERISASPNISLHALGYGYGVESKLLSEMAVAGSGQYAFIPDASMVGSVFVNFISSLLSTATSNVVLVVQGSAPFTLPGLQLLATPTDYRAFPHIRVAELGPIQFGQSRSLCIQAAPGWTGRAMLMSRVEVAAASWRTLSSIEIEIPTTSAASSPASIDASPVTIAAAAADDATLPAAGPMDAYARSVVINAIRNCLGTDAGPDRRTVIATAALKIECLTAAHPSAYLTALLSDLQGAGPDVGQIGHAVEKPAWYAKWGRHYLPSAARAHQLQSCMNFKDAALQQYSTAHFEAVQTHVETLFCSLPAPPPSLAASSSSHSGSSSPSASRSSGPRNMSSFYDRSGGCFFGSNTVVLAGGQSVAIRDLRRGDQVLGGDGQYHAVACVVFTPIEVGQRATYYDIGDGVLMTAYHPVYANGAWVFPIDVGQRRDVDTEGMYNFLLEDGTDMVVQGHRCITLAHGIRHSTVAQHSYLGTAKVADDIRAMGGWAAGRVVLDGAATIRDPLTNQITRWIEAC
eukprot:m.76241 g.76241  ORF g.76241 m.76241 type:complete len:759 (+) comp7857_c0_seq1:26-2302(+)